MTEETKVEEATVEETPPEPAPTPPSEETPKEPTTSEEKPPEEEAPKEDIDYKKELENLPPPPEPTLKRSEEEKADFTVQSILKRHPELEKKYSGEAPASSETPDIAGMESNILEKLNRNQAETLIREHSKDEDEVKYKMYFYDNRIKLTGNPFADANDAVWLATKGKTINAIKEQKRTPPAPNALGNRGGAPTNAKAPDLPPVQIAALKENGFKKNAKGGWEAKLTKIEYNISVQKWEQFKRKTEKDAWESTPEPEVAKLQES